MKELSLHLLDILENAVGAGACQITILLALDADEKWLTIEVHDNGKGMSAETLAKVCDPFYTSRTNRKVGMGISLMKQQAEMTGGLFRIESEPTIGTKVKSTFGWNHIDRQPIGDISGVVVQIATSYPEINLILDVDMPEGKYHFSSKEISQVLSGVPMNHPEVITLIKEMINNNLKDIQLIK